MRFIKNGPSIPDELLIARDQGRVVFFCGAGVSYARAKLPNFYQLAKAVCHNLGVKNDDPIYKLLTSIPNVERQTGTTGLFSLDRIFGALEREFGRIIVEKSVAEALRPSVDVDLSAHRILIDLSTTPEGRLQIVTTNFDRLFTDCDKTLEFRLPPNIPDPSLPDALNGIIYLHGRATEDYKSAESSGFVLSSATFGQAYLAAGWATEFFKKVISKYCVVFLGYTAEDPPVSYLLEALGAERGSLVGLYAFQSGKADLARGKWEHKKVTAISYDARNNHAALWNTLEEWAKRAKDVDGWRDAVIRKAKKGPRKMLPYEREHIAHIISTTEGARKFAESSPCPSAEWLCVFDSMRRYAPQRRARIFDVDGKIINPFKLYGLDSDNPEYQEKVYPEKSYPERIKWIQNNAWDAFKLNASDWKELRQENIANVQGYYPVNYPLLPPRLDALGRWLEKVSYQPAAVWWASKQTALHPMLQRHIYWELERSHPARTPAVSRAWQYLFEIWETKPEDFNFDWYSLKPIIDKDGWSSAVIRKYVGIHKPHFIIDNTLGSALPPRIKKSIKISDMLHISVSYPHYPQDAIIPDKFLLLTIEALRKNLEHALSLELELGHYGWLHRVYPIIPDDKDSGGYSHRKDGLSGHVIYFASLFERLIAYDTAAAHDEFNKWTTRDEGIFSRLRIWVAGLENFISPVVAGNIILNLSDRAFWLYEHQRDLLIVLAKRWSEFTQEIKSQLENRIRNGRQPWHQNEENFEEKHAAEILNRLTWLSNNGCILSFDLDDEIKELQKIIPSWKLEYGTHAADSSEGRGGIVRTNYDYAALVNLPVQEVLSRATEIRAQREDFLVENNPFLGMAINKPVKALIVLHRTYKDSGEFPEWAWRTFLDYDARKSDTLKLRRLIIGRLLSYQDSEIAKVLYDIAHWLSKGANDLTAQTPEIFDAFLNKLINIVNNGLSSNKSAIIRDDGYADRFIEAYNSSSGRLVDAMLNDFRLKNLLSEETLSTEWVKHADMLLAIDSKTRNHALSCFARSLNWFDAKMPDWTETNLVSVMRTSDRGDSYVAAWDGFLSSGSIPRPRRYVQLKYEILNIIKSGFQEHHEEVLAGMLLAGWCDIDKNTGESYISDTELRDVLLSVDEGFRSQTLECFIRWLGGDNINKSSRWYQNIPDFLNKIWPKQLTARTALLSSKLCDLAFADINRFVELVDIIVPLLTTVKGHHWLHPRIKTKGSDVVELYPVQNLAILFAILSTDAKDWPYGISEMLNRIGQANEKLKSDSRFIELSRRWNAR